jgi:sialic acid synthase SpsE
MDNSGVLSTYCHQYAGMYIQSPYSSNTVYVVAYLKLVKTLKLGLVKLTGLTLLGLILPPVNVSILSQGVINVMLELPSAMQ